MKLIFKIYKKVRQLKREERKVKENIERYKKEEAIKLERKIQGAWKEFHKETADFAQELRSREDRLRNEIRVKNDCEYIFIKIEKEKLKKREDAFDLREQELNELQRKVNDQILKLGIVNGVNK